MRNYRFAEEKLRLSTKTQFNPWKRRIIKNYFTRSDATAIPVRKEKNIFFKIPAKGVLLFNHLKRKEILNKMFFGSSVY